jgi:hypothetical protein
MNIFISFDLSERTVDMLMNKFCLGAILMMLVTNKYEILSSKSMKSVFSSRGKASSVRGLKPDF